MKEIPEGFMVNSNGYLVPLEKVKPIDLARNDLVLNIVGTFKQQQQALVDLKRATLGDIGAFVEMSAEEYGVSMGGKKGNITLFSYDYKYKLAMQVSEYITFDERLQIAKKLIDECIHEWVQGSSANIHALVTDAFQVDKKGQVSTQRIMGLRRLDIDDPKWLQAMTAIADSIQYTGSKTYVRAYERVGETDNWKCITLDFAALEVA